MHRPQLVLAALALLALLPLVALPVAASPSPGEPAVIRGAEVREPVVPFVFEGDLRDLPVLEEWKPGQAVKEIPRRHNRPAPATDGSNAPVVDPLVERQLRHRSSERPGAFETPFVNIAGQGYSALNPPDTMGEIGASYYIQMINVGGGTGFVVYDKATGAKVSGPTTLDSLGSGNCATGLGDPVAIYDEMAGRWVLTEFSLFGNRLCVYVSRTGDPISGGWYNYDFQATNFPDYPKYSVWPDAYYVSSNENLPAAYALERLQMLDGLPAGLQRFTAPPLGGFGFQALTPSDVDGAAPPAGAPQYLIRHRDDEAHNPGNNDPTRDSLEIFEFAVDWANPGNSTFTGPIPVPISEIDSNMCGLFTFSCFDQPGGADLDPLREVVMWRSQYRNFGTHQTLVGNLVTDVGVDQGGVRWYELRKVGAGPWTLHQEGTYTEPGNDNRFMGSAAMDIDGNIAVGFNVSGLSTFPALRYTGRLASDPLGVMTLGEVSLIEGSGSNSSNRYGDYSSLNVDPVDGCTFWFTGEYNTSSNWSTRIGSFAFDSCAGAGPSFRIDAVSPCQAGTDNTWSVIGATPNAQVTVQCVPLGSSNPVTVGTATADGNGDADISRFIPASVEGRTIQCVAEDGGTGQRTLVITKSFI